MIHSEKRRASWRTYYYRHRKSRAVYIKAHPELAAFKNAKSRCIRASHPHYKNYGERGIKFLFKTYQDIIDAIGKRPSDSHSLDRINNNGHYTVKNIRWATSKQQAQNRRK